MSRLTEFVIKDGGKEYKFIGHYQNYTEDREMQALIAAIREFGYEPDDESAKKIAAHAV